MNNKLLAVQSKVAVIKNTDEYSSAAIISLFQNNERFISLAQTETRDIIDRDIKDARDLQIGIDAAIERGLLKKNTSVFDIVTIDTEKMFSREVAQRILDNIDLTEKNLLITIEGDAGTGKGTTAKSLSQLIPNGVVWSNGNIFRALKYLSLKYSTESVSELIKRLAYVENPQTTKFDVCVDGVEWIKDLEDGKLKDNSVKTNLVEFNKTCQGEVILFVQNVLKKLHLIGAVIIQEGREATLNYFPTKYKFNLILNNHELIGQRRLAQRMASAFKDLKVNPTSEEELKQVLEKILETLD